MRIQLIILILLISSSAFAAQEKEMKDLFDKYYQVMENHKTELIDEVFSKKFLAANGGKEKFAKEVKELPKSSNKSLSTPRISFNKGVMDEIYFAKVQKPSPDTKGKTESRHTPEFIVVKEEGKLKIQGTISDGD